MERHSLAAVAHLPPESRHRSVGEEAAQQELPEGQPLLGAGAGVPVEPAEKLGGAQAVHQRVTVAKAEIGHAGLEGSLAGEVAQREVEPGGGPLLSAWREDQLDRIGTARVGSRHERKGFIVAEGIRGLVFLLSSSYFLLSTGRSERGVRFFSERPGGDPELDAQEQTTSPARLPPRGTERRSRPTPCPPRGLERPNRPTRR
jgi:hypothetical protein